ncbi:cytochrome P450 protein, variant 2 [Cymbomonas tetramitiformis]|uniref:Cytochrome P450 protein, variant 2 n=1 Tax=Cymbomonas tetramitiformis TaxID=36881 RepID=A0AAE0BP13_9CHLO|nr:cytochrome P450 protein, variant 2 [Cymbomonas tetramitiformis]
MAPGWMTSLQRNWGGDGDVPVADARPEDIQDLLGGALFLPLFKWMQEEGGVYLLPTGPISSFMVISDPACAKHILRDYKNYGKGLVSELSEFLFGDGFAVAEGELWRMRRRAVGPSLHKAYLEQMVSKVFSKCALQLNEKLDSAATSGEAVDMEANFSQLTLDIIGLSVFNYDFGSMKKDSPVIQAVYTSLKEVETRATDLLPTWAIPLPFRLIFPRQRKAYEAVKIIRDTTEELINKCKAMVEAEADDMFTEEYLNEADPSVLRFLLASREEVSSTQLRDDLLSMLVAGHETTGSVLTWTLYLLAKNPEKMALAQQEVDRVLEGRDSPSYEDVKDLPYCMRCINESMRLYPHPPVLLRRALVPDELPGGFEVPVGQDMMISVYNIHRSPKVWDDPDEFIPERFGPLDGPVPNEQNTDFRYIPFSGGPRKCVGDQFALYEAVVALSVLIKQYDLKLKANQEITMTTGATIHTQNGLYMHVHRRNQSAAASQSEEPVTVAS